jgi:glycerol-3-phosphate dehydrogenase
VWSKSFSCGSKQGQLQIETDPQGVISILGGKFTDCINVGEEIVRKVRKLIPMGTAAAPWFGEEGSKAKTGFDSAVKNLISKGAITAQVADQLWRRHGSRALEIAELLESQPETRELVFEGLAITFGELEVIAENEEVKTAEDLLRRRLPIALARSKQEIKANQKLQSFLKNHQLS